MVQCACFIFWDEFPETHGSAGTEESELVEVEGETAMDLHLTLRGRPHGLGSELRHQATPFSGCGITHMIFTLKKKRPRGGGSAVVKAPTTQGILRDQRVVVGLNVSPIGALPLVGESDFSAESDLSALDFYAILYQNLKSWKIQKFPRQIHPRARHKISLFFNS